MTIDKTATDHMEAQDKVIAELRADLLAERTDNDHLRVEVQLRDAQIAALMNGQKVDYI